MSFKDSLAKGLQGENIFASLFPHLKKLDGRKSDFVNPKTGRTYEVKCDSYDMLVSPNFFIEIWSDVDKKKVGGPRQALKNDTDFWVYIFEKNSTMFLFSVKQLVKWMEANENKYRQVRVMNKGWVTVGAVVSREDLAKIYKKKVYKTKSLK